MFWRPEYLLLLSASVASFEDEVGSGGLPELDNLADLLGNHYGLYLSAYTTAKAASTQAKKRAEDTSMAYKKAALKVAALKQELKDAEKVMLLSEETMRRAKQEKLVADKKYKDCVTNMAHNIIKAGGGELDMPEGEEVPEVILYSAEDFSGKSFSLDKLDESIDFKYWNVKSIKISNALLFASLEDQGDELSYSFSGSVRKIADYIPFRKKCCDRIRLRTPPNTNAVELYSAPNFKGRKVSFLGAGDYDVEAEIQSVRVAAGYRLHLFRGDAQAGYLDMFLHDNAVLGDTNSRPARRRTQKIKSIRVKNDRPDVVRALLMIDDREQSFPADPGVYLLPRWGAISAIHIPMTAEAEFRLRDGTTIAAINGSAPPTNATHVDVRGKCGPDYCGDHGRCVGPDECRCSGGFSGNRCTIQFPDSSSSIVCDSVAAFVDDPITCYLIARKDNEPCTTHTMYVRVYPRHDAFHIFESPLSKRNSWGNPPDVENNVFPFKVVSNQTGTFSDWAELLVLHRSPGTYSTFFQPELQILPLPRFGRVINGSIVFDALVPSSAIVRLENVQHKEVRLSPLARPATTSFRVEGELRGTVCIYIEFAGMRRNFGCETVNDIDCFGSRDKSERQVLDPAVAWFYLFLGMWQEALRAATLSRNAEVIILSQLAIGFGSSARINAQRANISMAFLKGCFKDKCPIEVLAAGHPSIPWYSSVPAVLWYEHRCIEDGIYAENDACRKFAAYCEDVLDFLPISVTSTLILWATAVLQHTDVREGKRVLKLVLQVVIDDAREKVMELLIIFEKLLFREHGERSRANSTAKEEPDVEEDYYEILGVSRGATEHDIKKAYRQLAILWHPDKNKEPGAGKMFLKIKKAYETLVNLKTRAMYDGGEEVDDIPDPVRFRYGEINPETNTRTVYWYDPSTGEEGSYTEEMPERFSETARPVQKHCCLP